jgi:PilZ domain
MEPLKRLYERYEFVASAVLIDESSADIPARVSNISYGGCRLLLNHKLAIGAEVTVKIHALEEDFEAPAKVVHSSDRDAGLMFGRIAAEALFVLQKWIAEARYLQSMNAAE